MKCNCEAEKKRIKELKAELARRIEAEKHFLVQVREILDEYWKIGISRD